jgi:hypothetical protein
MWKIDVMYIDNEQGSKCDENFLCQWKQFVGANYWGQLFC